MSRSELHVHVQGEWLDKIVGSAKTKKWEADFELLG